MTTTRTRANPEPSSRHGWTHHGHPEVASGHTIYWSSRRSWLRCVGYALILGLVLLMDVLGDMPVVAASSHAAAQLPIPKANYTLQQFLKQGKPYQAKDAPLLLSQGKPAIPRGITAPKKTAQSKPGTEPAKMKAVSQALPTAQLTTTNATASATASPAPLHIVGSDAVGVRLEIVIPAGAIDTSQAVQYLIY